METETPAARRRRSRASAPPAAAGVASSSAESTEAIAYAGLFFTAENAIPSCGTRGTVEGQQPTIVRRTQRAVLPRRLPARRSVRRAAASLRRGAAGRPARGGRRPDRRLRPGRAGAGRAARRASPRSGRRSSTAGTARSRWARPTASPAAPWRCSRRSGWPTSWCAEGYWVNEVAFWRPDPDGPGQDHAHRAHPGRRGRPVGVPARHRQPGADARLPPRLHGALGRPGSSRSTACRPPTWRSSRGAATHPVTVTLRHVEAASAPARPRRSARSTSSAATARAAASARAIGRELVGDAMNQSWGVMDVLAVTDFPDIRLKSRDPLGEPGQPADHPARGRLPGPALHRAGPGRATARCSTAAASPRRSSPTVANRILHPYTLDVKDVGWWSVYEIGQRLCDKFDDVPARRAGTGSRGCSSPATPATRTAPRPARA